MIEDIVFDSYKSILALNTVERSVLNLGGRVNLSFGEGEYGKNREADFLKGWVMFICSLSVSEDFWQ